MLLPWADYKACPTKLRVIRAHDTIDMSKIIIYYEIFFYLDSRYNFQLGTYSIMKWSNFFCDSLGIFDLSFIIRATVTFQNFKNGNNVNGMVCIFWWCVKLFSDWNVSKLEVILR